MEEKDLEEIIQNMKNGVFNYIGITPDAKFDRDDFINHFYWLGKVRGYEKKINETKGNPAPGVRKDLAEILFGSKDIGLMLPEPFVRDAAKEARKTYEERMAFYVQNNYDDFIGAIDKSKQADDMFVSLAFSVPLYKQLDDDGKVKDNIHNKTIKRIRDYQEVEAAQKAAQEGDGSKMRKVVEKSLDDSNLPGRLKKLLKNYLFDQTILGLVFQAEVGARANIAKATLTIDGKKVDRSKIKGMLEDSLDEAWRLHGIETNPSKRGDIYEDDIIPIYMAIADIANNGMLEEYQKELIDARGEQKDEIERAEDRAMAGIGTGGRDIPEYI